MLSLVPLMLRNEDTEIERDYHEVHQRVHDAITQLAAGDHATIVAARQIVRLDAADSQRAAETAVRRAATQIQRRIAAG